VTVAEEPVTVHAAGTVLWRREDGGVRVGLVHRSRHDDWSLPKGKHEPGETDAACAVRETEEETGLRPVLRRPVAQIFYTVEGARKRVRYFSGSAPDGDFVPNDEVDELRWLPVGDARRLLSYDNDRGVLDRFASVPADSRTLLLVRHAKAGDRERWTGPDELRPLSPAGRAQAAALTAMLLLFGPSSVFAAPRTRCVDTVAGLAAAIGTTVAPEPAFSEEAYAVGPDRSVARLLALLDEPGTPVVCGQGGAIPAAVARLAAEGGIDVDRPRSKKGSTWVLTFGPRHRLLAADYLPTALPAPVTV
jgi:8-oxo-(d)GTP phosphatase